MFNNPPAQFSQRRIPFRQRVNAACDALDGVVDGVLNDPRRCHFNRRAPVHWLANASKLSHGPAGRSGSTFVDWAEWVVGKRDYYPPFERGGEIDGWPSSISRTAARAANRQSRADCIPFFQYFVFDNPTGIFKLSTGRRTPLTSKQGGGPGSNSGGGSECDRSDLKPSKARAQTHPVPRLQRSRSAAADQYQLLR